MALTIPTLGLREKIAVAFVAFGVLPMALLLVVYMTVITPKLRDQSYASFRVDALEFGAVINRMIGERIRNVVAGASAHPVALDPANWKHADGSGALNGALNADMRANRVFKLMMMVAPDGSLLAVNTIDPDGKSLATAPLYAVNFGGESWFQQALASQGYEAFKGAPPVVVSPIGPNAAVAQVYGDKGMAMALAAPVKDASRKTIGVWVSFYGPEGIATKVIDDYKRTALVGGDIAKTWINYQIQDSSNKIIYSFVADSATAGHTVEDDFGKDVDPALLKFEEAKMGDDGTAEGVIAGRATVISKMPATGEFTGLGWRLVMSGKAGQAFATANGITMQIMLAILITAIAAVIGGILMGTSIAKPILALAGRMRGLAAGDRDTPVPYAERNDDIGQMGKAVVAFQEAAFEKDRLEAQADTERQAAEAERAKNEVSRTAIAEEQTMVVEALADGLSKLSEGDLTCRLNQTFPAEYVKLQTDFNAAMQTLQEAMKTIVANTDGMLSGAGEISQAADDLSRRTEQQAASLEQTAAALDQITATVKRTAEGSNQANGVVATARADAEKSGEVVRQAVTAMTNIDQSALEISNIIGVIDEIAFQTNLLALNAGVEAARAGEAGRGFAVVATEVRALAQRSAQAAKEIKALISTSTSQVKEGVGLVGQTGEALQKIVAQVAEITALVSEIAASAQEQSTGLAEVNTAVNQMDQMTQQNAAMVEQSTAASHALAQEARELGELVGRFQIGDRTAGPKSVIKSPVHKAQARAQAFAAEPRASPQLKTTGSGAAARKAQPDQDGWEDF